VAIIPRGEPMEPLKPAKVVTMKLTPVEAEIVHRFRELCVGDLHDDIERARTKLADLLAGRNAVGEAGRLGEAVAIVRSLPSVARASGVVSVIGAEPPTP